MTKLSSQVKGSLNITTPGVQIWRIEVRPAGCQGMEWTEAWDSHCPPVLPCFPVPMGHPALYSGTSHIPCSFPFSCPQALLLPVLCLSQLSQRLRWAGKLGIWGTQGSPRSPFSPQAMQMVPVPSSALGSFFDGDCYVVLAVSGGRTGEGAERTAKQPVASGRTREAGGYGRAAWLHRRTELAGCAQRPSPG